MSEKKAAIDWQHPNISVNRQSELIGLSKGALYYSPTPESKYNLMLMGLIDQQYLETPFYGSRKMTALLNSQGYTINRKRTQRLMEKIVYFCNFPRAKHQQAKSPTQGLSIPSQRI